MHNTIEKLDEFIYITTIFKALNSSKNEITNLKILNDFNFWNVYEKIVTFVSLVSIYKQAIETYYSDIKEVQEIKEHYYTDCKYFRFLCIYRNLIVHQLQFIRDYDKNTGDLYLDIDDIQNAILNRHNELPKKKKNSDDIKITNFIKTWSAAKLGKYNVIGLKQLIDESYIEILIMTNAIFNHIFEFKVKELFENLLSSNMSFTLDGKNRTTYNIGNHYYKLVLNNLEQSQLNIYNDIIDFFQETFYN